MTKRKRRDQRSANPSRLYRQDRDIDIIDAVYQYRILRQDQLQALFFGSRSTAQYRLRKLYDHSFLKRRFLSVVVTNSPTMYILDKRGAELLQAERGYDDLIWTGNEQDWKDDFIEHTLAINDVRGAVTLACRHAGYTLETWRGERELKADYDYVQLRTSSGRREQVAVIPDSYFTIVAHQRRYPFLLELDRGTMVLKRFKRKVRAYREYYRTGGYERRFGHRGLRVLTVTPGEQRRDNLKTATEQVGGEHHFWFATLGDITPATVLSKTIWHVADSREIYALIPAK